MKVISIRQPWATLIAIAAKTYETRSWKTNYRGLLAIHAAKNMPRAARETCFDEAFYSVLKAAGYWIPDADRPTMTRLGLPFGAIVAVAELAETLPIHGDTKHTQSWVDGLEITPRERAFGDWTPGRYAWRLANVRPLATPIPCRGAQGLWTVPPQVEAEIRRQLGMGND